MFTPGQLSDMLEIPPSTLRRYVTQFAAYLSDQAQRQRGRRFTPEDVDTLGRARELLTQGRSPEEVGPLLQVVREEGDGPEPGEALALVPAISEALAQAVDAARALRSDLDGLADQVAAVAQDQGATDAELQQLREWLRRPWWRRLFSSPPPK